MNSDFNKDRLIKLINQTSSKQILIHQDHKLDLNFISKETNANISIKTSDLRYTKGLNTDCENTDLVIYIADSYEPQEIVKRTINKYVTDNDLIFISEKKSAKSILKLFECEKKFHTGNYLVGYLKKQQPINIDVESNTITTNIKDITTTFQTEKGLFSYKNIDAGTQFLLNNITINEQDEVLDFACGYGAVGITLAKKYPQSKLMLTDSKLNAIEFTKNNAKLNNLKNVEIKNTYLLRGVSGKYDKIISNPPTHMKLYELDELMMQFKELLKDDGEIFLVINNIVDYERIAKKYFNKITIKDQNEQYKIIQLENK